MSESTDSDIKILEEVDERWKNHLLLLIYFEAFAYFWVLSPSSSKTGTEDAHVALIVIITKPIMISECWTTIYQTTAKTLCGPLSTNHTVSTWRQKDTFSVWQSFLKCSRNWDKFVADRYIFPTMAQCRWQSTTPMHQDVLGKRIVLGVCFLII